MRRIRTILTGLALVGLSGISLAAAFQVFEFAHVRNTPADHQQLLTWLVTHRVSEQTPVEQRRILRLVNDELRRGVDWSMDAEKSSPEQWKQIGDNFDELTRVWFEDKADGYAARRDSRKAAYIDMELDNLANMSIVRLMTWANPADSPKRVLEFLAGRVDVWNRRAAPKQRELNSKFLRALEAQLAGRPWQRWLFGRSR